MRLSNIRRFVAAFVATTTLMAAGGTAQAQGLQFEKSFSPDTIAEGGVSTLTLTIENIDVTGARDIAVTDNLPAGMTLADGAASTSCQNGIVTGPAGSGTLSLSGGELGVGATCTVTANVTAGTANSYLNTTGDLTSSLGNHGPSSATLTVDANELAFSKTVTPDNVQLGGAATIVYTVTNPTGSFFTNLAFSESFPAGVTLATPANASSTCSNAIITQAEDGGTTFATAGGFILGNSSCTYSVDIVVNAVGTFDLVSSNLNSSAGSSGASSDTITVDPIPADSLGLTKAFSGDPVAPGGSVTLEFTLRNPNVDAATNIAFSDDLDAMLSGATAGGLPSDPCGTGSSLSGSSTLTLSGGSIAGRDSCSFSVTVDVPGSAAGGEYPNTTSAVTADINGAPVTGNAATDTLSVLQGAPAVLTKTFSGDPIAPGSVTPATLEFTIQNPNPSGITLQDLAFTDTFGAAGAAVTFSTSSPSGICGAGSFLSISSDSNGLQTINLIGGSVAPNDSCTFSLDVNVSGDATPGTYTNTTSQITGTYNGGDSFAGNAATDTLTIGPGGALNDLQFFKSFDSTIGVAGGTVEMTLRIENPSPTVDATQISFTDDLDAFYSGTTIASITGDTCLGLEDGTDDSVFSYSGGSVLAGSSCEITVELSLGNAAAGSYTNTTNDISAAADAGAPAVLTGTAASASLTIQENAPLVVSKSFADPELRAGDVTTLTFRVDNPNDEAATGISFEDELATVLSDMTFNSGSVPATPCGASSSILLASAQQTMILFGGEIAANGFCEFSVDVTIPVAATDGTYVNRTETGSATVLGVNVGTTRATDSFTVLSDALALSKTFLDDPVVAGGTGTLRFTLTNASTTGTLSNITFSDDLDAMLSGTAATGLPTTPCGAGSALSGSSLLTLTGGTLAPGGSCSFDVTLSFPGGATADVYTNTTSQPSYDTASATGVTGPVASDSVTVLSADTPSLSKSFAESNVAAGATLSLSFTIDNPDNAASQSNLSFSDSFSGMPAGTTVTGLPATPCGSASTLSYSGSTLTLSGGDLDPLESCNFTVSVNLPASAAAGTYTNTTSPLFRGGVQVNPPASDSFSVEPAPGFAKSFSDSTADVAEPVTLTFTIDNSGSVLAATSLDFTDNLPAGLVVAATPNGSTTCTGGTLTASAGSGTVAYSGGTIGAGATCTVTADVTGTTGGSKANVTSALTSSLGNSGSASATLTVNAPLDPTLSKSFSVAAAEEGETIGMTLTLANPNNFLDGTVTLTDDMTGTLEVSTAASGDAGCSGGTVTGSTGASAVGFTGTLAAGQTCTITVGLTVTASSNFTNEAQLTSDMTAATVLASDTLTVTAANPPALTKTFSQATADLLEPVTLTLTLTNSNGFIDATGVSLTDALPTGLRLASDASGTAGCNGSVTGLDGETTIAFGGDVAAGATCTITASVVGESSGNYTNEAGYTSDLNGTAITDTAALTVDPAALPTITKVFPQSTATQGESVPMSISIANPNLFAPITGVEMTDTIDPDLTISTPASGTGCSSGTVSGANGASELSFTGALPANTTCTIIVGVTVTGGSDVTNTAQVTSDLNAAPVTDSDTLAVTPASDPTLDKTFSLSSADQGQTLTLTLAIGNANTFQDFTGVALTDSFPAGLEISTAASADAGCTGGTVTGGAGDSAVGYSGGTVAAGDTCTITAGVRVVGTADISNDASVASDFNATPVTDSASITVTPAEGPTPAKSFDTASADQGQTVAMTITLTNPNTFQDNTGVALTDSLPAGLELASAASADAGCTGGTLTGGTGDTSLSWTGGTVAVGDVCTITADVLVTGGTDVTNTVSVTSDQNAAALTANAGLTITAADGPEIAKTFAQPDAEQGETVGLTITLTNPNTYQEITGLSLSDVFAAGTLELASDATLGTDCTGGTITGTTGEDSIGYTGGTLPVGTTCTVTADVLVLANANLSNTSEVTSDFNATANTATDSLTVTPAAGPAITKAYSLAAATQGQSLSLTVTLENQNTFLPIGAVEMTDSFPAGLELAAAPTLDAGCTGGTLSGAAGGTAIGWSGGTIAVGATCTITADVTVTGTTNQINTASVTSEFNTTAFQASDALAVTPATPPQLDKSFSVSSADEDQTIDLTLTITNANTFQTLENVVLTDSFPAGLEVANAATLDTGCVGGTVTGTTGDTSIGWSGGSIAPGTSCTITLAVQVTGAADLTNTAEVTTDINATPVTDAATLTVTPAGAPELIKTFSQAGATQGESLTMTLSLANTNAFAAIADLTLIDSFPAGLEISTAPVTDGACDGTVTGAPGETAVGYTGGSLAAGETCTLTVGVTVTGADTLTNTAEVTSDRNATPVSDDATLSVSAAVAPTLTKSFSAATATEGETLDMVLEITNPNAFLAAEDIDLSDSFPAGLVIASDATADTGCTGGTLTGAAGETSLDYTGGTVATGATCLITVGVTVSGDSDLTNTASLTSSLNATAVEASASLVVTPAVLPTLTKSFSAATVTQGEALTMTLAIGNPNAFIPVGDVTLTDSFPAGLEISTAATGDAACDGTLTGAAGDSSVTYTGGTLDAGETCTVTVGVTVTGTADLSNTAALTTDRNATAIEDSASLTVTAAEPPVLTKSFSASTAEEGESLTMTLSVENPNAFQSISDIALTDAFPAGLEISTAATGDTACATGTVTGAEGDTSTGWTGGTLAPGEVCTITVGVTVTGAADLTNTASVTSDLNATPVESSASLAVTPAVDPVLTKSFSETAVEQGAALTMTLSVENPNAFVSFADVMLTDAFPEGLEISTAATANAACADGILSGAAGDTTVSFTGGTLAPGATCTVTVGVTATGAEDLTNTASLTTDRTPTAIEASAELAVTAAMGPTLAKSFSETEVEQGQTVTMTLTLENPNAFLDITDVALADAFPDGLILAAAPETDPGCTDGALTGTASENALGWTGTVAVGATCIVTAEVTVTGADDLTNTATVTSAFNATATEDSASLTVTAAAGPVLTKSFSPSTAEIGEEVTLTLTLENPNQFLDITEIALADSFPGGLAISTAIAADAGCTGGTLTGDPGDISLGWTDGTLAVGDTCTITVGVTGTVAGELTNTASVTSAFNTTATEASADLTITGLLPPTLDKSFTVAGVVQGETTGLTLVITNPNGFSAIEDVTLTDSFPDGLVLASAATADAGCGAGTATGAAGETQVGFAGGSIAPGDSCTVSAQVTALGSDDLTNTASVTSDANDTAIEDSAALEVTPAPPPGFVKAYAPDTIFAGETSRVLFTIDNSDALVPATDLAFTDAFDAAITLLADPGVTNTCGGTVTANGGDSALSLSGGTLAAGATCQIGASVTATDVGEYSAATAPLTSSLGNSGAASATLTVQEIVTGQLTIVQRSDPDGTFTFSSAEPALNVTLQTSGGEAIFGPVTLDAGRYRIRQTPPPGFGNVTMSCDDANSRTDPRGRTMVVNLEKGENVTCFIASLQTDQKTIETINRFLFRRADLILSSEPSMSRRIERLTRGYGNASTLRFSTGDLMSFSPLEFDPFSVSAKNVHVSGSLLTMRQAAASLKLAHGDADGVEFVSNYRWDAWFEAQVKKFDDSEGEGRFGILYFGADYIVNDNLLVGIMAHVDRLEEESPKYNTTVEGTGWMVGPYMTARLSPNLYFDARVAAGRSVNEISPFNTYTDEFDTTRWMAQASLTGEVQQGPWMIRPNASLAYYREKQDSYTDALGVFIPSQTIELGQFKIGPTFSGRFETRDGLIYEPTFSVEAIYNMGHTMGVTLSDPEPASEGWRGRVQAGVTFTTEGGARIGLGASYDGLFRSDYNTYGLTFDITIPLAKPVAE